MSQKQMGRPKLDDPNVVKKSIRFSPSQIQYINLIQQEKNLSFGAVIREAVNEYIKKRKNTDK